jgi:hypothetical protein
LSSCRAYYSKIILAYSAKALKANWDFRFRIARILGQFRKHTLRIAREKLMGRNNRFVVLVLILYFSLCAAQSEKSFAKEKLSPEKLVAAHLKSIAGTEVLAKIKSRGFGGVASVHFLQGATGNVNDGQFLIMSEGHRLAIIMKFADLAYPGEYFAFDGDDVSVGHISPGQRSPLADFIYRYNSLMKEGLMGGVLSAAWPFWDLQERKPNLKYKDSKVEGRKVHELEYRADKGMGAMTVKLYFEQETFRHIRTEYRVRVSNDMSAQPGNTQIMNSIPDSIYRLVEKFDDFKEIEGMMLPHSYSVDYSVEGAGNSFVANWNMAVNQWSFNGTIDPSFFKAQK